jgi:hypothetical protein
LAGAAELGLSKSSGSPAGRQKTSANSSAVPSGTPVDAETTSIRRPSWLSEGVVESWHMEALEVYLRRRSLHPRARPDESHPAVEGSLRGGSGKTLQGNGNQLGHHAPSERRGVKAEARSIEATRKFTENAHRYGIRVCGYIGFQPNVRNAL